jgi:hypothetical protein
VLRKNQSHENYERAEKVKLGSDKKFGLTLGIIFSFLGLAPLMAQHPIRLWALIVGFIFISLALTKPKLLSMPNLYWSKLGLLLGKIISPFVLFLLFFLVFLPIGLLLKVFRKDILNLKINKEQQSYWIKSETSSTNMVDQF